MFDARRAQRRESSLVERADTARVVMRTNATTAPQTAGRRNQYMTSGGELFIRGSQLPDYGRRWRQVIFRGGRGLELPSP